MQLSEHKLKLLIKILFSIIPISILIGSTPSIINIITIALLGVFIFIFFVQKFSLFANKTVRLLLILYLYLIFNTFISLDYEVSAFRNIGFIRYIFLFVAINFIFYQEKNVDFIFKVWLAVILIVFFDIFFEFYNGKNILGFPSLKNRIGSFFKDEAVIGSFVNSFIFLIFGYLLKNFEKKKNYEKLFTISFLLIGITSVIFTGERASTIKLFFGLFLFFLIIKKTKYIYLTVVLASIIIFISANFGQYKVIKTRFYDDIFPRFFPKLYNVEKRHTSIYFHLYASGIEVFKKYPVFGVGTKNYRVETCVKDLTRKYKCNTHPHQIYVEFLSEHGLAGTILLLYLFFSLIFKNFRNMVQSKNYIQIGCFTYLITHFIPLIPSGSFFSDFNSTFFFLNLSLLYAVNSNTNIFKKIGN